LPLPRCATHNQYSAVFITEQFTGIDAVVLAVMLSHNT